MQGSTEPNWIENCGSRFLRPTIEIIRPKVIVTLGERAYRALSDLYGIQPQKFRAAVEREEDFELEAGIRLFPVYHCGARILNTHRPKKLQEKDWRKIKKALEYKRAAKRAVTVDNAVS